MSATAVYAAESQWSAVLDRGGAVDFFGSLVDVPQQRRFADLDTIGRFVAAVLALPAVATAYPVAGPVRVRDRAGRRRAHYEPATTTIAIPMQSPWALRESVVLHEVAHHLDCTASAQQAERRSWHGPSYREAMGLLVEQVLGGAAALLLRAGYDGAGVRR